MEKKNLTVKIRKTTNEDIDALMCIFGEARKTIAALGIDQWQDGYPNNEVICGDVKREYSYCAQLVGEGGEGDPCATFALVGDGDPCYDRICDGAWLADCGKSELGPDIKYLAIHRVAISVACRGSGIASQMIAFATEYARSLGKISLRIDTHEGNVVMRRSLEKCGFLHVGVIHLADGAPRVAYEKVFDQK